MKLFKNIGIALLLLGVISIVILIISGSIVTILQEFPAEAFLKAYRIIGASAILSIVVGTLMWMVGYKSSQ